MLCGVCATKHLKANKDHEIVEFGVASKRDVGEAVQKINAEKPTYLNLTIANGLNGVNEIAQEAIKATFLLKWKVCKLRDHFMNAYPTLRPQRAVR